MRSSRLVSILLLLQARRRMTARELAKELEVSLRTVYRDVEALAGAGIPVYAEHGRAGGYQLVDGYRTRLTGLTEPEAASLFMVGLPGPAADLGLGREAASAELKLLAALGPEQRVRAARLRDRFHLDMPTWYREPEESPHLSAIAEAVMHDRRIDVVYRRWAAPREVERTLDPYGLVLKGGAWYVVAGNGTGARVYRVSNILRLTPTGEEFARPAGFDLAEHWRQHLDEFESRRFTGTAVIKVSPYLAPRLLDLSDHALHRAVTERGTPEADGWIRVEIPIESVGHAARQLIRHGTEIEALSPPELRSQLATTARSLLTLYADQPSTRG